jgi:dipicolinate synthase subunit B
MMFCLRNLTVLLLKSLPPRKTRKESDAMNLSGLNIGVALTGSFCTFANVIKQIENLVNEHANVIPILSFNAQTINTRFGKASDFIERIETITGNKIIRTIEDAEPLGPQNKMDVLVIAPCTGNTLAKLANGITDTPVIMAAKGHLRNLKPLVISLATNDALGLNLKNIGTLLSTKNIYFVPFFQDDFNKKPNSMISNTELILPTIEGALKNVQIEPIVQAPH